MSFSFNGPSFRPMIQESQSMFNDGGGGNTGYFQRGKKKKQEKTIDVFAENNEPDSFTPTTDDENELSPQQEKNTDILNTIIEKTKKVVKKAQTNIPPSNNPFGKFAED